VTEVLVRGSDLADAVFGLRRVLRRVVRQTMPGPVLPPAEAELLVTVGRTPDMSVTDAARAMQLAPNTVSTLVGRLVTAGLLVRRPDPEDGRVVRLRLSAAGTARMRQWRQHRDDIFETGLAGLEQSDRDVLLEAVSVLRLLTEHLERLGEEQ
jgi:DNA-binding MarR family transcriptional regulator